MIKSKTLAGQSICPPLAIAGKALHCVTTRCSWWTWLDEKEQIGACAVRLLAGNFLSMADKTASNSTKVEEPETINVEVNPPERVEAETDE